MSILKGILHHWNKTNKNYDTIHPETESVCITDWHQGIVNTLASTALSGLVNTLTSDSLLAKMIQKVLTATGVKYNMAQNGYICLGSLFGGLIIQWGKCTSFVNQNTIYFNVAFASNAYYVKTSILNDNKSYSCDYDLQIVKMSETEAELFLQAFTMETASNDRGYVWIAVGR